MPRVFISYGHGSKLPVTMLAEDIEPLGYVVWFDRKLEGGQNWWNEILAEIERSDVFVFALSNAALLSRACIAEYGYGAALGKPILPVLVADGVNTEVLSPALSAIQYVDYRKPDKSSALALSSALHALPSAQQLPDRLPEPPPRPGQVGKASFPIEVDESDERSVSLVLDFVEDTVKRAQDWHQMAALKSGPKSRMVRRLALVLSLGGYVLLLLAAAHVNLSWLNAILPGSDAGNQRYGTIGPLLLLSLCVVMVALDRFFGFSSAYWRHISAISKLEKARASFYFDRVQQTTGRVKMSGQREQGRALCQRAADLLFQVHETIGTDNEAWATEYSAAVQLLDAAIKRGSNTNEQ